jgi:hypothetical protein
MDKLTLIILRKKKILKIINSSKKEDKESKFFVACVPQKIIQYQHI